MFMCVSHMVRVSIVTTVHKYMYTGKGWLYPVEFLLPEVQAVVCYLHHCKGTIQALGVHSEGGGVSLV